MPRLKGERVLLRPFREEEADQVWRISRSGVDGFMPDPRRPTKRAIAKRVERSGQLVDGRLDLAIEAEGRLVGEIDARQPKGALPQGVFEFGIAVYDRDDRGKGFGEQAVWLLTRHLFEAERAERVQATTDVENRPMRGVLEKLGFAFEGVLRAYGYGDDGRRDYAMYAMTRSDHERG
ncbi:MAG: GNAT family N-acetyltransferase [Actinomycetota bacterium]